MNMEYDVSYDHSKSMTYYTRIGSHECSVANLYFGCLFFIDFSKIHLIRSCVA